MGLLLTKESLYYVNKAGQNVLMLAIENYFDEKIFIHVLQALKKEGSVYSINTMVKEKDLKNINVGDYIAKNKTNELQITATVKKILME